MATSLQAVMRNRLRARPVGAKHPALIDVVANEPCDPGRQTSPRRLAVTLHPFVRADVAA
ncbi:MAG: hypothetical protein JWP14_3241 [Frankiales bacterium]|nr:hypothetical protein [Frankiales bacterium]